MKSFAWLAARRRTVASVGALTAAAVTIATLAAISEGFPTTEVELNDGGVWVTKQSSLLVGHFNHESRVLDGGLRTTSDDYDILQSGQNVMVVDAAGGTVTPVDPAMVSMTAPVDLPRGGSIALGGDVVAILDPASGDLWAERAGTLGSFTPEEPLAELGEGAVATVGTDGTVYAVSTATDEIVSVGRDAAGEPTDVRRSVIDPIEGDVSITAVGTTAVVLDESGQLQATSGLRTKIENAPGAVLQQPSATNTAVQVASDAALISVPLDGADETRIGAASGTPAAPVYLDGCAYAAWSGSGSFVRDCLGEGDDLEADVEGANADTVMQFRVNRNVVVLNDIVGGAAWMASDSLQRVDNWNDVTPPEGEAEEDEETTQETVETTLPERTEQNTPPEAVDDDFGVRPGRTTVLPVLDNDNDPDGDVLVASVVGDVSLGAVQPISDGAALQIAVPEDASGSSSFTYQIDDGRGGTDTATVRMTVRGPDVNGAPEQKRTTTVTVESGGTVSYNVLPDWIDPDGDDVFLQSVTPAAGDEADFTSDGRITYRAIGATQGIKDVPIRVSDGQDATEGTIRFDVRPPGSTVPVTNADHVVVRVGQTATVAPLANDTSASREPLRLAGVDDVANATIVPDFANKTFSFTSDVVDVYYVQYLASTGPNAVPGLVRVDVIPAEGSDLPPVAVRDVALLPSGGDVLVNVLANDSDPSGGILVVQSVTVEPNSGIAVAVLNHETLRITDQAALTTQVTVKYRISNGAKSAEGEVVVIPVPAPAQLRPPVATDDTAIVRAGDVVTIPVLDNDYHPNGDAIHLSSDLIEPFVDPADGEIFVSQDTLRFRAGPEAGTVYATYEVVDSTGQKDAGYVTIQVLPVNAETNAAPRPRDLTARALSGAEVRVAVPLDGIDPDGDSVELVGIASAPGKGRVVETGTSFFVYEAFADAVGVDTFTYRVRDALGAESTAQVRIGIAPAEAANQAPYAVKDSVIMRPGRSVAVPVLSNDSDPDGDEFGLVSDGLVLPNVRGLDAEVDGDRVVVTSPDEPVETSLQYTIRDSRGATAMAVLQITVADDVPLQRPIARDDVIRPIDVVEGVIDLEVLANDEDPDGTRAALAVTTGDPQTSVLSDGTLRITLGDVPRLLTYTITDPDGLTASAFVRVPALTALPPTLTTVTGIEVRSGETVEIPLADHVRAAGGARVILTEAAKVSAIHSNGAGLVKDDTTLVYTSADRYFGQDALTFEVTDGTGADDPNGRKATLTLPITVIPPENQPPTFANGNVDVAPGEDASTLDLLALTTDPDPDDLSKMTYQVIGGAPNGFTASVEGQQLRVGAASNTPKGSGATLRIGITDGTTAAIEGSVTVLVTASTRPLATANDDIVAEAHQGDTASIPVLTNDFNPFPDTPLKVVSASVETGDGDAVAAGDQVQVTPAADFFGTMVVRYRIQDATADTDREVEGRIRLTVQGRPAVPGMPTVTSVQDRTVVMSWTPPADNGASITGYTVNSVAGNYTKACKATTCTLDGLTNNVEYNFVVVATNRVGDSDPSPASQTARPDARPDTPNPPALVWGDRAVTVNWVTPSTPGSPVQSYDLEISPAPPSGVAQKTGVTGNSMVWDGLENGRPYQVRVRAVNLAPEPSSWSGYSATTIPAGVPDAPGAPSTARVDSVGTRAQMQVSWTAPYNNGDAIGGYDLKVLQGGSVQRTIPVAAGQTSQVVEIDASTTNYTFTVAAKNKAGTGADSPQSAPRRAVNPPDAPTNVQASTPAADSAIVVTYQQGAANGANSSEIGYEYNVGGGWRADWDGRRITGGISNNNSYTVQVRAYTTVEGVRYDGAASAPSNAAAPYGPVGTPGASAVNNGQSVTLSWTAPGANGRPVTDIHIRINGGAWESAGAGNGSRTVGNGYSQSYGIEVVAVDSAGQRSSAASASARTSDPPSPRVWVTQGSPDGNCVNGCRNFVVNWENLDIGTRTVRCYSSNSGLIGAWNQSANFNGRGSKELDCFAGRDGQDVWVDILDWGGSVDTEKQFWPRP